MDARINSARMDNLKRLRKEKGYTCESLGILVGVKKSAMSKYERGEIQPSKQVLLRISEVLGCSVDYLFEKESQRALRDVCADARMDAGAFDGLTEREIAALSQIAMIFKEQRGLLK